jgi:predicted phage tail protein
MRAVKLYGHLGKRFGRTHRLDVASPAEAIRALSANFPEFRAAMAGHQPGYHVHVGGAVLDEQRLPFMSRDLPIKFVPVVAGAKNGIGQIIIGAAIIWAAFATGGLSFAASGTLVGSMTGTMALSFGASLILGGVSQMLIGAPKTGGAANGPNNMPNYAFNGPVNTIAQGNSVPVCYGRLIVGSQVISANLSVEQTTGRVTPPTPGVIA